jgi:hypothetical protein
MNAKKLLEFLLELETDGVDLSQVSINYRDNDDSDVEVVRYVGEDLFDQETNSILESIVLQSNQP